MPKGTPNPKVRKKCGQIWWNNKYQRHIVIIGFQRWPAGLIVESAEQIDGKWNVIADTSATNVKKRKRFVSTEMFDKYYKICENQFVEELCRIPSATTTQLIEQLPTDE